MAQTEPVFDKHEREAAIARAAQEKTVYLFLKRAFDIIVSGVALLLLSPLMLVLMLLIYLDDPKAGPIYKQQRCGCQGKQFTFFKLRTMIPGADKMLDQLRHLNEMDGPVFKVTNDPRMTRLGPMLRKTSLDELPQLFNVLRGDMSLVGPRPPLPNEVAQYDSYTMQRLSVKPGLTCYWQIMPKRNSSSFEEWVALDLQYIQDRSVMTDLKILFKTAIVMIKAEGA